MRAAAGLINAASGIAGANSMQLSWPSIFPALAQRINDQPLAFLDSAATTLRPHSVIDALVDRLQISIAWRKGYVP